MRVLAICYEDPSRILGGMGMHVRELYREMAKIDGVEIDLLVDGEKEGSIEYLGYTKHYSDKLVCWKPRKPDFACLAMLDIQMAKTLARLLAEGRRWDVVHCHEWNTVQIARMARDALGAPLVGTMHLCLSRLSQVENGEFNVRDMREADLYMMQQEGHLVSDPDQFILCSNSYVEVVRNQFMTSRPINMIYNGVDLTEWCPGAGRATVAREKHGLSRDRPIALYVGRVATMKGIQHLITRSADVDDGWQIVVAGEVNANSEEEADQWDITKRLKSHAKLCPHRFKWLGFQHGRDLKDLYAAADAVIMPSIHEPFGIVALEAMAMGTPLISTEVDGLREVVVGDDGEEYAMIIPHGKPSAIGAALDVLKDAGVRDTLRKLGLERARHFSWSEAARKTVSVYRDAIDSASVLCQSN